jgi:hypothetical protein
MTDPKHPQKGTKKEQKPSTSSATARELSEEELKRVAGGMMAAKKASA